MTTTRSRVPPLLEPYVCLPPEASLILLTGINTATPHWLTTRFLARLLGPSGDDDSGEKVGVVFASWMRDEAFWAAEARRGAGLDLRRLEDEGRWRFVDGMTSLFLGDATTQKPTISRPTTQSTEQPSPPPRGTPLALGRGPLPTRGPAPARAAATPNDPLPPSGPTRNTSILTNPALDTAVSTISAAIDQLGPTASTVLLILDSPTLLLATDTTTSVDLTSAILQLRSKVHSALVVVEADTPLLSAATQYAVKSTPLEAEHAAFVVGMGHTARMVMGTRGLDTGVARDVSGVLTVRRGGGEEEGSVVEEMEVLYRIGVDGSAKVFERGMGDA